MSAWMVQKRKSGCSVAPTARASTTQWQPGKKGIARNINSDQAKGRIKEAAGDLTGNDKLKDEGKADQAAGDVKKVVDDGADKVEELVDKVRDAVTGD